MAKRRTISSAKDLDRIDRANGGAASINVIQFGAAPRPGSSLTTLAKENRGKSVFIDPNNLGDVVRPLIRRSDSDGLSPSDLRLPLARAEGKSQHGVDIFALPIAVFLEEFAVSTRHVHSWLRSDF